MSSPDRLEIIVKSDRKHANGAPANGMHVHQSEKKIVAGAPEISQVNREDESQNLDIALRESSGRLSRG